MTDIGYIVRYQKIGRPAYMEVIDTYCFRVALTQIRLGVLPINSNMNRYGLNPRASMCPSCKEEEEDEKHFLVSCPIYGDLRKRFLNNVDDVHLLIEGKDRDQSYLTAKYIFHAMKKRKQLVNV